MALRRVRGTRARAPAARDRPRARLVPRHAGLGRRLGVLRRRQQPAHLQQYPVRRSRRPARPVHGGPDRTRPRAPGHARRGRRATPRRGGRSPSSGAPRPSDGSWYGRWGVNYIYGTWSVLRGAGRHRRGLLAGVRPARGGLARLAPERRRRLGRDARPPTTTPSWRAAASRSRARPRGRSSALFAAGRTEGPAVERGIRYLLETQSAGRHLGGPALERHRLPARLLSQVPPVRQVLPALGPRRLSERARS